MSPGRGIILKLTSVLLFMVMAGLIKVTSGSVPPGEAVFFRSLFAMPTILVWLWLSGEMTTRTTVTMAGPMTDTPVTARGCSGRSSGSRSC